MARLNRGLVVIVISATFLTFAAAEASATLLMGKKPNPSPAKNVDPSPAKNVDPSPAKNASPSPAKNVDPSPAKNASPSPAKNVDPSPAKNADPSPAKNADPSPAKNVDPSPGALLTKSSAIKVGQTQVYTGTEPSGKTIMVILTRTRKGLVAFDGTCTAQGEKVVLKKTQLVCQSQGSVYNASTGDVVLGPNGSSKNSIPPLSHYTITEKAGNIYIK